MYIISLFSIRVAHLTANERDDCSSLLRLYFVLGRINIFETVFLTR